jgi:hypothetical protein
MHVLYAYNVNYSNVIYMYTLQYTNAYTYACTCAMHIYYKNIIYLK